MTEPSETDRFLDSLPRVGRHEAFSFDCHPDMKCFRECCADLTLILSPYDVLRLRRALDLEGKRFLRELTRVTFDEVTGFPVVQLSMRRDDRLSCPFVTDEGCSVYENRPGACRTYPLGRGASLTERAELYEQLVVVREDHCRGFDEERACTVGQWLEDQGLAKYDAFNDRYLHLISRWRDQGSCLTVPERVRVLEALYCLEELTDAALEAALEDPI